MISLQIKKIINELPLHQKLNYFQGFPELLTQYPIGEVCRCACEENNVKVLELFYNPTIHCNYLLHRACVMGSVECVYWLIKNTKICDWNWGLVGACHSGNIQLVDLMIRKGARDWRRGILSATQSPNCSMAIVQLLTLKHNRIDTYIDMALNYSYVFGNMEVFEYLLKIKIENYVRNSSLI